MAATKEQEQKALEKIKKIVTDLGEDSYISMAFEGCFEIAEVRSRKESAKSRSLWKRRIAWAHWWTGQP